MSSSPTLGRDYSHAWLADAKNLLSSYTDAEISVIRRDKNTLAHELASRARRSGDFMYLADVPADIRDVMRNEYAPTIV